jgi:hypothetical protein
VSQIEFEVQSANHRRPEHGIYYARFRMPSGTYAITGPFDTAKQAAECEHDTKQSGNSFFKAEFIGVVELPDGPVWEGD